MQWPEKVVAESVLQQIETYKIDAVVTFDKHGVSRHRNHISLFYAIASLCIEKKVPPCKYHIDIDHHPFQPNFQKIIDYNIL